MKINVKSQMKWITFQKNTVYENYPQAEGKFSKINLHRRNRENCQKITCKNATGPDDFLGKFQDTFREQYWKKKFAKDPEFPCTLLLGMPKRQGPNHSLVELFLRIIFLVTSFARSSNSSETQNRFVSVYFRSSGFPKFSIPLP